MQTVYKLRKNCKLILFHKHGLIYMGLQVGTQRRKRSKAPYKEKKEKLKESCLVLFFKMYL